jgi:hypothetical protein
MPRGGVSEEMAVALAAAVDVAEATGMLPHGGPYGPLVVPDPVNGACCMGSAVKGAQYCTCWEPVFDLVQQPLQAGALGLRRSLWADCAYKPGSPERSGDPCFQGDEDFLDGLALAGTSFFCHQGVRRTVKLVHPSGAVVDLAAAGLTGDYRPPIVGGVPYKADGSAVELCAGWAARRRRHLATEARES